jgi:DNA-binding winged helix-turn-helix (wHTH) protein
MQQADFRPAASPADPAPDLSDFILGDWLVEPELNRLSRQGTALHVRPQLMDVLVCLAGASGRTVHRDELLRRVWPGQSVVAESAIARCIAELRQVLGDHATSPTLIETIHKRGYRVIAPVVAAPADPARPDGHARPVGALRIAAQPPMPRPRWLERARLMARQFAGAFSMR